MAHGDHVVISIVDLMICTNEDIKDTIYNFSTTIYQIFEIGAQYCNGIREKSYCESASRMHYPFVC